MTRRARALTTLLLSVALLIVASPAWGSGWHSAQPLPPAPPEGEEEGVGVPVPLGHIGQISFWAPNHGLLITSGTEIIPAGLYYYNGVSWRELSNVCGGNDGRIAWAGENDFWTISNQQTGQQEGGSGNFEQQQEDISLCHFENGAVVASYAEPIGAADSYEHMDAAACSGPDNCWFGGETLPGDVNTGAFHLHWNGVTLTPVPALEALEQPPLEDPPYAVRSVISYQGRFYESVQPGEDAASQILIHKIHEGSSNPFQGMIVEGPTNETGEREPFSFSGTLPLTFSADASELWVAGGETVALLNSAGQFQQISLHDPDHTLASGITAIAAEPGSQNAWVALRGQSTIAEVAQIQANGDVSAATTLPEPEETIARKGPAGAITCPAPGDCWLATAAEGTSISARARSGWLFHLGGNYPEDNDLYFEKLITYRPPDASIPFEAPEDYPEDDSGDTQRTIPAPAQKPTPKPQTKVRAPLFSKVHVKLIKGNTLALSFTLVTKSRVQLLALRHKHTVAATRRYVLNRGRHTLDVRLNRHAWPTKLKLRVKALGEVPLISPPAKKQKAGKGGSTSGESEDVLST